RRRPSHDSRRDNDEGDELRGENENPIEEETTTSPHADHVSFMSDHEITLKDKQEAMNREHPFGMPIWKPALYRKSRSVVRKANRALHLAPSSSPQLFLQPGNILWTILFGWWLALVMATISLLLWIVPPNGRKYSAVTGGLAFYLLWPFGRYVERIVVPGEETEEDAPLLGSTKHHHREGWKTWLHHIASSGFSGWWGAQELISQGTLLPFLSYTYYTFLGPLLFIVSTICWMCVITIPMSKLNYKLLRHLGKHPLSIRFHASPSAASSTHPTVILLCTYQAVGFQYYKYTYEGINIIFINLLSLVFFVILDEYVIHHYWPESWIASPMVVFSLSLGSVIPLSYFIGMGVSSVSAQTSMAVGSVINATFGSIIEIILYAIALMGGKSALVEGSLIGSILVGVLLLPGSSMVSGGMKRKEQRFNSKSAGVTSTMLIMAIIGALSPTMFYQLFGSFQLRCTTCPGDIEGSGCSQCHYDPMDPAHDPVYQNKVKPFMWICAAILPSAYIIGLVFSLHTHVDMVWKSPTQENSSQQRKQQRQQQQSMMSAEHHPNDNSRLNAGQVESGHAGTVGPPPFPSFIQEADDDEEDEEGEAAGHDAPEWGKAKSFTVLFACTLLYSIIAEILVDTVDLIMADMNLDEKFLGLTLFALVPNITEFTNAIGFSIHGNIVLSMEIGSAYALQVCLLQIPAMVLFSWWLNLGKEELARYTF
ncbi:hypothetical protein BX666DRAFT_1837941, partial [Dichotomocladium elegans]